MQFLKLKENLEWEINNRKGKGNNNITTTTITKVS